MPGKRREAYAQLFLASVRAQIVASDRLTKTELRLWLLLATALEWGGAILISQRQMAGLLGITEGGCFTSNAHALRCGACAA